MPAPDLNSVFINCPFDDQYYTIFKAMVFTVSACGFKPRCTQEQDNAAEPRIEKIYRLIAYAIHDISRTQLNLNHLPRFNMPFELGVFLGAIRFGTRRHRNKRCLILDTEPYRYQQFLSDIAGQDINAHEDNPERAVNRIRNWLRNTGPIPGAANIWSKYQTFSAELPILCEQADLDPENLVFNDYLLMVNGWLRENR
jgi:hypothetical protein